MSFQQFELFEQFDELPPKDPTPVSPHEPNPAEPHEPQPITPPSQTENPPIVPPQE